MKSLAVQTGKATEDIARHISAVQNSTGNAIDTLRRIAGRMREIDDGLCRGGERRGAAKHGDR